MTLILASFAIAAGVILVALLTGATAIGLLALHERRWRDRID